MPAGARKVVTGAVSDFRTWGLSHGHWHAALQRLRPVASVHRPDDGVRCRAPLDARCRRLGR
jgi:hypothetical protein